MDEIVNRIANSGIITIDLDDYFPNHEVKTIDLKDWLFQGLILKEKDFRDKLEVYDWSQYQDAIVTVYCSTDAIIPYWAYMLMATRLKPFASEIAYGNKEQYLTRHYIAEINKLNIEGFKDKRVVIKGCGDKPVPVSAYMEITQLLQPVAKSIMYGEVCSTVPVYKKKIASESTIS
jgi:hypothetical protein